MVIKRHLSGIGLILAVYLILAIAYSIASPIFETPDEINHFYVIQHLARTGRLPVLGTQETAGEQALYGQEGGQPPLYYAIGAMLIAGLPASEGPPPRNPHANIGNPMQPGNKNIVRHSPTEAWPWSGLALAVHLLRFFSILLGAGTVFFIWKIADGLFPTQKALALAVAAFVAFLPQFLFISAAVSNDNLIIFLSTFILWLLLWWFGPDFGRAPRGGEAWMLGIFLGLAAMSKLSGLYLWGVAALAYLIHLKTQRDWRTTLEAALFTGVAAVAVAFPWFWRNWRLYGDPTALTPFLAIVGRRTTPIHPRTEFQGLRVSALGLFGWFNIPLPQFCYQAWDAFLAIGAIGFLQGAWRRRQRMRPLRRYAFLMMLALWLGIVFLALVRWVHLTMGAQGRLLFPAIASLSVLLMLGWREWLPGRERWLAIPPGLMLALSIYGAGWVIPAAYRPPRSIPPAAIPAPARIEPVIFDGRMMLAGVQVEPMTVRPGQTFEITLYWRRLDETPYDASLYIHVLGRGFENLVQVNSYPGWGAAPTSQWRPDEALVDKYRLTLPGDAPVPTRLVVDVGMYDFDSRALYAATLATGERPEMGVATLRAIPANAPDYDIAQPTDFRAGDLLSLAGYDLPGSVFHPGQELPLTLYWRAQQPIGEDYQVFVHLLDENGTLVAGYDKAPQDGWWPTSLWEPGQTFDDSYPLALPATLPPGSYELRAGLYRLADLWRLPLTSARDDVRDNAAVLTKITISP